ncbi:SapC family protein [Asticcacaulis sp. EMRT-3]|uniref:SapC family protein n=1 Tax=Asticcacaulis sp. EMRT-3 TaxID=3040349 RepID=UPI0024AFA930|nr:SapC family protein [Asticcacaulis sp. EMRT-3]MDI7774031.1 SapC family protein [Asticcacaulis sp. EMRT-3]
MGQHVLLNNVDHHDLRLITRHGASFGDNINQVLVFPSEYDEIQRHYPIFFRRTESGGFKSVALLGFDKDENLFLDEDRWDALYVPAMQRISPFLIGQPTPAEGEELPADAEAMILVDPEHPRISTSEGESLFLPHGGQAPNLVHVTQLLQQVYMGEQISPAMFAAFYEAGLLAPVEIEVQIDDTTSYVLNDLLTISREALRDLSAQSLKSLNEKGFLALAFIVVSSMANMSHLITRKNKRLAAQRFA